LKRHPFVIPVLCTIVGFGGCATTLNGGLHTTHSPARTAPLGARYAWVIGSDTPRTSDPRVTNRIIDLRVRMAFDSALSSKGYQLTRDPTGADLQASYRISIQDQANSGPLRGHMFCNVEGCIGGHGPIETRRADLTLELLDKTTGKLAWGATAAKAVNKRDADQDRLNHVAREMTTSLPPAH
jgi:hypothetical protein